MSVTNSASRSTRCRGVSSGRPRTGVPADSAGADAGDHPAGRDVVHGQQILGQGDRVTEVGRRHPGTQSQAGGRGRRGGQRRNGAEPVLLGQVPPGQVIIGPAVGETPVLQGLPSGAGFGPVVLGKDDDSDAHPGRVGRGPMILVGGFLQPDPWLLVVTPSRLRPRPSRSGTAIGSSPESESFDGYPVLLTGLIAAPTRSAPAPRRECPSAGPRREPAA